MTTQETTCLKTFVDNEVKEDIYIQYDLLLEMGRKKDA